MPQSLRRDFDYQLATASVYAFFRDKRDGGSSKTMYVRFSSHFVYY